MCGDNFDCENSQKATNGPVQWAIDIARHLSA